MPHNRCATHCFAFVCCKKVNTTQTARKSTIILEIFLGALSGKSEQEGHSMLSCYFWNTSSTWISLTIFVFPVTSLSCQAAVTLSNLKHGTWLKLNLTNLVLACDGKTFTQVEQNMIFVLIQSTGLFWCSHLVYLTCMK